MIKAKKEDWWISIYSEEIEKGKDVSLEETFSKIIKPTINKILCVQTEENRLQLQSLKDMIIIDGYKRLIVVDGSAEDFVDKINSFLGE